MNKSKKRRTGKKVVAIAGLLFLIYNIVLFAICGGIRHGIMFWISYVFILGAFVLATIGAYLAYNSEREVKDWIWGYPIAKHCAMYMLIELFVSGFFMILDVRDINWIIGFVVQLLILAFYVILIISGFMVKEEIRDIEDAILEKTRFLRELRIKTEEVKREEKDIDVQTVLSELSEMVKYSDPVSGEQTICIEGEIEGEFQLMKDCLEKKR